MRYGKPLRFTPPKVERDGLVLALVIDCASGVNGADVAFGQSRLPRRLGIWNKEAQASGVPDALASARRLRFGVRRVAGRFGIRHVVAANARPHESVKLPGVVEVGPRKHHVSGMDLPPAAVVKRRHGGRLLSAGFAHCGTRSACTGARHRTPGMIASYGCRLGDVVNASDIASAFASFSPR